jgi:pimeloyl-ACP methyl ester carboxylesterase
VSAAANGRVRIVSEARGTGRPLLLIHGLGYARWGWDPVVDGLAARYCVIRFDNRGIGESDKPPGPYSARELADDALRVLDEHGVERAHVVGASLGGMVAQELALAAPARVDRLVLACTTAGGERAAPFPPRFLTLLAEAQTLEPAVALRRLVENSLAPGAPAELVERIYRRRLEHPPDPAGWQAQATAGTTYDGYDRIAGISAPTLVVHGTEDNVVATENADILASLIPNARVELFPGCGHLFFWEQPERFVQVVSEFLG